MNALHHIGKNSRQGPGIRLWTSPAEVDKTPRPAEILTLTMIRNPAALMRVELFISVCVCAAATANAQNKPGENPAEALEMPTVEIVGTTPLPGLGTPMRDVPAN